VHTTAQAFQCPDILEKDFSLPCMCWLCSWHAHLWSYHLTDQPLNILWRMSERYRPFFSVFVVVQEPCWHWGFIQDTHQAAPGVHGDAAQATSAALLL